MGSEGAERDNKRVTGEESRFSPVLTLPGLQDDQDLQALLKGSQLLKVKSSSWRRERFYKLQEDCKTIWQESRKVMRSPESQLCECPGSCGGGGTEWRPVMDCDHRWATPEIRTKKKKLRLVGVKEIFEFSCLLGK